MSEGNNSGFLATMHRAHTLHALYGVQGGSQNGDLSVDLDALPALGAMGVGGVVTGRNDTNRNNADRNADRNVTSVDTSKHAAEYQAGRRMFAEPRLLGVLVPHEIKVRLKAGTGPGRHAFHKEFKGDPFPLKRGAVVNFDIRFERGFEWGCRGKVGGLFVGPGEADGGEHSKNGASLRLMWDAGGGAYAYVYVPRGSERSQPQPLDEPRKKGIDVFKDAYKRALVGTNWHRIKLGVKLNTFSKNRPNADGELLLSIDDKQRVLRNVIWRMREDFAVEQFVLSFFHGGPCRATRTSGAAVRDVHMYSW